MSTNPPSVSEAYKAIRKVKSGKASGICGKYPEHVHHAG